MITFLCSAILTLVAVPKTVNRVIKWRANEWEEVSESFFFFFFLERPNKHNTFVCSYVIFVYQKKHPNQTWVVHVHGSSSTRCRWHRDIPYIVSGTTPFWALLLVHFSQCLFERCFFHFGKSRAMKGVIFFFIFEILKRGLPSVQL